MQKLQKIIFEKTFLQFIEEIELNTIDDFINFKNDERYHCLTVYMLLYQEYKSTLLFNNLKFAIFLNYLYPEFKIDFQFIPKNYDVTEIVTIIYEIEKHEKTKIKNNCYKPSDKISDIIDQFDLRNLLNSQTENIFKNFLNIKFNNDRVKYTKYVYILNYLLIINDISYFCIINSIYKDIVNEINNNSIYDQTSEQYKNILKMKIYNILYKIIEINPENLDYNDLKFLTKDELYLFKTLHYKKLLKKERLI